MLSSKLESKKDFASSKSSFSLDESPKLLPLIDIGYCRSLNLGSFPLSLYDPNEVSRNIQGNKRINSCVCERHYKIGEKTILNNPKKTRIRLCHVKKK